MKIALLILAGLVGAWLWWFLGGWRYWYDEPQPGDDGVWEFTGEFDAPPEDEE